MSDQNDIKIVVDTNLWISMLIGKKLNSLKGLLLKGKIKICFSEELFEEIIRVLDYPRLQKIVQKHKFYELISLLDETVIQTNPKKSIQDCRDSKDNFLLDLAVEANVDYLITGDKDLLELNPFRNIEIITAGEFEEKLKVQ